VQLAHERQRSAEIRAEVESDKRRRSEAHVKDLERELASLRASYNEFDTS